MNKFAILLLVLALSFANVSAGHSKTSSESELLDQGTDALFSDSEAKLVDEMHKVGDEIGLKFKDEDDLNALDKTTLTDILLKSGYTHCAGKGEICTCPPDNGLIVYGNGNKYTAPVPSKGAVECVAHSFDHPQEYTTKFHDPKTGGNWLISIKKKKNFIKKSFLALGEEEPNGIFGPNGTFHHGKKPRPMCLCKVSPGPSFLELSMMEKYNERFL